MLFRETPSGPIAITQPSHAWLSGQILRAWGNAAFGTVTPFEDVCLAAEQHDIGWLEWEAAPTVNTATGRPHSFREIGVAGHTAIWSRGTALALALGRYPALLVSLHGTGLYANYAGADSDGTVRRFLDTEAAAQARLIDALGNDARYAAHCDPGAIERNRGLVRAADRMSIAICTAMQDIAISSDDPLSGLVRQVPTANGDVDLVLRLTGDELSAITVSPWPFAAGAVSLLCEGIVLPQVRPVDERDMRAVLATAPRVAVTAELRPVAG